MLKNVEINSIFVFGYIAKAVDRLCDFPERRANLCEAIFLGIDSLHISVR